MHSNSNVPGCEPLQPTIWKHILPESFTKYMYWFHDDFLVFCLVVSKTRNSSYNSFLFHYNISRFNIWKGPHHTVLCQNPMESWVSMLVFKPVNHFLALGVICYESPFLYNAVKPLCKHIAMNTWVSFLENTLEKMSLACPQRSGREDSTGE